jgi:hypothetical protein
LDRLKLIQRVRTLTRDFNNSIFRENDIIDFINEGVNRFKQVIPELDGLTDLDANQSVPTLVPTEYHHLLSTYAASKCFFQDDRQYQASSLMNEFETKLDELKNKVENGEVVIKDADGIAVVVDLPVDYVDTSSYFGEFSTDVDLGVEGVM